MFNMSSKPGIVKEGWLKRVKNQKKRYFVLCFNKDSGAAQLTYYENERKFTAKSEPKRIIFLQDCLGIISKEDAKHGHTLVLYTKDDVFAVTAETEELLNSWLNDLDKLHKMENTNKNLDESKYDLVWNVKVMERGLAFIKKMAGSYKLCLKDDSLFFVDPTTQEVKIEEKLFHIRRYGHMDYCFFMEFGRSTTLGAGEIWMEVEDPLIAQKIHETLSRSAKPASGENTTVQKNTKSNRHSMVAYSNERYGVEHKNFPNNNNNNTTTDSPKTRRLTLNVFSKKKEVSRPHSKSVSLSAKVKGEGQESAERVSQFSPRTTPTKDDEDSEEENKHYPRITPPVPSISRRKSKSSMSGSMDGNTSSKNKGPETKSLTEESEMRCEENFYTELKPKRRSVSKQNCNDVRRGYAAEKRRSATYPRNRSVSDADRRRIDSEKSSDGDRYGDSDKDCAQESDKEDDGNGFLPQECHYLNMKPRQRITSDSSSDGPSPYLPVRPPNSSVDHYIKMNSPRVTPDLENTCLSTSSARSDETEEMDPEYSSYVNMSPSQGISQPSRMGSSSNESADDTQTGDSGEETFDHLHHDDTNDNGLSQSMNYVNMGLKYNSSSPLKKSLSHSYHSPQSDYVNVNMSRSKSMGSKSPRSRVFEIVKEPSSSGEEEAGTHSPRSYVNVKAKGDEGKSSDSVGTCMSYENLMLGKNDGGRKETNMNYISVDFSEKTSNGNVRGHSTGRSSPSNYSKIDFNKSRGLADVSSTRERELHGTQ